MAVYAKHYNTKKTPQSEAVPGREAEMIKNAAGAYSFAADDQTVLDRFLIIGTEGGSYYESEKALTVQNAKRIQKMLDGKQGVEVVGRIVEISDSGRAVKNSPAIFALALAITSKNLATRKAAATALPQVCRIGTHLFEFCEYIEALGGWGRLKKAAVGGWYHKLPIDKLALQLVKYRQRNGWTHRDVLRLSHPHPALSARDIQRSAMLSWVVGGDPEIPDDGYRGHALLADFEIASGATPDQLPTVLSMIKNDKLPREALPTWALNEKSVWEALLPDMPMHALTRNLGNLGKHGVLVDGSWDAINTVVDKLSDVEQIKKSRLHPLAILLALKTYEQGHGTRGHGEWPVVRKVVDALNAAFYQSFGNVVPTGKRILSGIDESGSMGHGGYSGGGTYESPFQPCELAAIMAMTTVRVERNALTLGFHSQVFDLPISPSMSLQEIMQIACINNGGATNASVIIETAIKNRYEVDAFILYSDGETWAGDIHVFQALEKYRKMMGIPAKLLCVNFTASQTTMRDPLDALSADFVGMDASLPQAVSEFLRIG